MISKLVWLKEPADDIFELGEPVHVNLVLYIWIFHVDQSTGHHAHVPHDHPPQIEIELLVVNQGYKVDVLREVMAGKIVSNCALIREIIDEPDELFEQVQLVGV